MNELKYVVLNTKLHTIQFNGILPLLMAKEFADTLNKVTNDSTFKVFELKEVSDGK